MAFYSYKQSRLMIVIATLPERARKGADLCAIILIWLLVSLIIASLLSLYIQQPNPSFSPSSIDLGFRMLYDFAGNNPSGEKADTLLVPARTIGAVIFALFSGMVVARFLEPVQVCSLSRYVVLDARKKALVIRYWIKRPESKYFFDADINIDITRISERNVGIMGTKSLFSFNDPRDNDNYPGNSYRRVRGVRYVEIPLDSRSPLNKDNRLMDVLNEMVKDEDTNMVVSLRGRMQNGRLFEITRAYTVNDVLPGFQFVSIRRDEVEKNMDKVNKSADRRVLFFEHFNMVCDQGEEARTSLGDCHIKTRPKKAYELQPSEVIPKCHNLKNLWNYLFKKNDSINNTAMSVVQDETLNNISTTTDTD